MHKRTNLKYRDRNFDVVQPSIKQAKLPLRMAGQSHDKETNLFYNYFRFYDPKTGRYVTSDPIGLQGGMNTYGYVGGSPLHFIDPTGEFFFIPAIPATVQAAAAAVAAGAACYATNCGQAVADGLGGLGTWMAGRAPHPNTISHEREKEILAMNGYEPCKELKKAIDDLEKTIAWRKSDLSPSDKGKPIYVGHQKRIKILREQKEKLERRYKQSCAEMCVVDTFLWSDNNWSQSQ